METLGGSATKRGVHDLRIGGRRAGGEAFSLFELEHGVFRGGRSERSHRIRRERISGAGGRCHRRHRAGAARTKLGRALEQSRGRVSRAEPGLCGSASGSAWRRVDDVPETRGSRGSARRLVARCRGLYRHLHRFFQSRNAGSQLSRSRRNAIGGARSWDSHRRRGAEHGGRGERSRGNPLDVGLGHQPGVDVVEMRGGLVALSILIALEGCGHDVTPTEDYSKPESIPICCSSDGSDACCGLVAFPFSQGIEVSWNSEGSIFTYIDGWLLYRATGDIAPADSAYHRLFSTPDTYSQFRDSEITDGVRYWYRLTSVSPAGIESVPSSPAVARADFTPPPPPSGLSANVISSGVELTWSPSSAGDLDHYNVFRIPDFPPFVFPQV